MCCRLDGDAYRTGASHESPAVVITSPFTTAEGLGTSAGKKAPLSAEDSHPASVSRMVVDCSYITVAQTPSVGRCHSRSLPRHYAMMTMTKHASKFTFDCKSLSTARLSRRCRGLRSNDVMKASLLRHVGQVRLLNGNAARHLEVFVVILHKAGCAEIWTTVMWA